MGKNIACGYTSNLCGSGYGQECYKGPRGTRGHQGWTGPNGPIGNQGWTGTTGEAGNTSGTISIYASASWGSVDDASVSIKFPSDSGQNVVSNFTNVFNAAAQVPNITSSPNIAVSQFSIIITTPGIYLVKYGYTMLLRALDGVFGRRKDRLNFSVYILKNGVGYYDTETVYTAGGGASFAPALRHDVYMSLNAGDIIDLGYRVNKYKAKIPLEEKQTITSVFLNATLIENA